MSIKTSSIAAGAALPPSNAEIMRVAVVLSELKSAFTPIPVPPRLLFDEARSVIINARALAAAGVKV